VEHEEPQRREERHRQGTEKGERKTGKTLPKGYFFIEKQLIVEMT